MVRPTLAAIGPTVSRLENRWYAPPRLASRLCQALLVLPGDSRSRPEALRRRADGLPYWRRFVPACVGRRGGAASRRGLQPPAQRPSPASGGGGSLRRQAWRRSLQARLSAASRVTCTSPCWEQGISYNQFEHEWASSAGEILHGWPSSVQRADRRPRTHEEVASREVFTSYSLQNTFWLLPSAYLVGGSKAAMSPIPHWGQPGRVLG